MKGTMGWSRRSERSRQYARTPLAAGSSSLGFTASTYQSASSFHTNSKQRLAASSSRNCSSDAVASRITACARDRIQRSASVSERRSIAPMAGTLVGSWPRTNCAMFHSLFAKLRPGAKVVSKSLGSSMTSAPSELPAISVQRRASAPNNFTTSSGSIPLPSDLDILRCFVSRTVPCR